MDKQRFESYQIQHPQLMKNMLKAISERLARMSNLAQNHWFPHSDRPPRHAHGEAKKKPHTFEFREVDDLIQISLLEEDEGCQMVFTHIFDDKEMAMYTAAGWHRCLDVLQQIVNGHPVEWKDNSVELREFYREAFDQNS